jgi:hypothetical protein
MIKFRPGMQVEVPFGTGFKRGTVVDVLGSGATQLVSVLLTLTSDAEEPLTQQIGFLAKWIHPVPERAAS